MRSSGKIVGVDGLKNCLSCVRKSAFFQVISGEKYVWFKNRLENFKVGSSVIILF